jgi:uncharacterized MAPEG superfamily protein
MRLQLTVYSLALLAVFALWQLLVLLRNPRPPPYATPGAAGAQDLKDTLEAVVRDALYTYVPFAAIALLMLSYGKPGLLPQWAAWAVVMLQVLRSLALAAKLPRMRVLLALLALICLIYLWVLQLPYFDPFPL